MFTLRGHQYQAKHIRHIGISAFFTLCLTILCAQSAAQSIDLAGYLSAGISYADDRDAVINSFFDEVDNGERYGANSKLGVQFSRQFSPTLQGVIQFVGRGTREDFTLQTEWAYFNWQPKANTQLRIGKTVLPIHLISEHINVGYSYPWVTPPREVYGVSSLITTHSGIDISQRYTLNKLPLIGHSTLETQFNAGRHPTLKVDFPSLSGVDITNSDIATLSSLASQPDPLTSADLEAAGLTGIITNRELDISISESFGFVVSLSNPYFSIRINRQLATLEVEESSLSNLAFGLANSAQAMTELTQIIFINLVNQANGGADISSTLAAIQNAGGALNLNDYLGISSQIALFGDQYSVDMDIHGLGITSEWQDWLLMFEAQRFQLGSAHSKSGYLTIARHIGNWMPLITVAGIEKESDLSTNIDNFLIGEQVSVTLGLNYEFNKRAVIKTQLEHINPDSGETYPGLNARSGIFSSDPDGDVLIGSFVIDVVF
ncbi:MAG TPA: hypothetical protein DCZ03_00215 [Gammaproteobacteria bacterium]|nr:hypothetical protein [Gammaproteobacteria bacterium]